MEADGDRRIFISYRRADTKYIAGWIANMLSSYSPVFMDLDAIGPGMDFAEQITTAVNKCRLMLVLIGPGWLKAADDAGRRRIDLPDDWVAQEIRMGLRHGEFPIVPLLVDGTPMPAEDALPEDLKPLARRQAVPVRFESFQHDIERLMESLHIKALPPKLSPIPVSAASSGTNVRDRNDVGSLVVYGVEFRSIAWYRAGVSRSESVARIETGSGDAVSTGFLVAGQWLHPALPPTVFLTCAHVIPEALDEHEAIVSFHGAADAAPRTSFRAVRTLWTSPSSAPGLNVSVLELDGSPLTSDPVPISPRMPLLNTEPAQHVWVIGHPRGTETPQISSGDTTLLDYDATTLHYSSATQPGSSGSPVFDDLWRLIGIHHSRSQSMRKLNGASGTYAAGAGTRIHAVIENLRQELG
jgi:V8-like Glu-specific endopeptidase